MNTQKALDAVEKAIGKAFEAGKKLSEKRFLCYQQIVKEVIFDENEQKIEVEVIVRNVGAKNKEEALGKFILETNKIKANKKLEPIAFRLDYLTKID